MFSHTMETKPLFFWNNYNRYKIPLQLNCLTNYLPWFIILFLHLQLWFLGSTAFTLCEDWGWREPVCIQSCMWFYPQLLYLRGLSSTFLSNVFKVKTTQNKLALGSQVPSNLYRLFQFAVSPSLSTHPVTLPFGCGVPIIKSTRD